ncbi:MAG: hypothetical protein HZC38_02525 [Chloroflexi bacterium]|nr:hypothetical protein [Chloroflexota bacterium]
MNQSSLLQAMNDIKKLISLAGNSMQSVSFILPDACRLFSYYMPAIRQRKASFHHFFPAHTYSPSFVRQKRSRGTLGLPRIFLARAGTFSLNFFSCHP